MRVYNNRQFRFLFFRRKENFICRIRLCSTLNNSKVVNKDPFHKRPYKKSITVENESRIANRICLTILGNGGIGQPRCVGLFTDLKSYLFNCGQGVGRLCREYDINMCSIKHVFITQRKWENISGLSDIYITNQMFGIYRMSLFGPSGVEHFESMLSSKKLDTIITKKEGGYIDHTLKVDPVPLTSQNEKPSFHMYNKRKYFKNHTDVVFSYICQIFQKPGDFLVEKCIEHGVPIGPDLLKLKNGENIVLPSGKTVCAEDVHGPVYSGTVILIVDCPSESFLESLINEKTFEAYQMPLNSSSQVSAIFHFTPNHIFTCDKYQDWMNRFHQDTQHFALNSNNPITSSKVVHQTQRYLNLLHPKIFTKLRDEELITAQEMHPNINVIYPHPMMQIWIRPENKFCWNNVVNKDQDNVNVAIDGADIVMWSQEVDEKLKDMKLAVAKKLASNAYDQVYPEVLFLGTSSATSTAYRNVSAILMNISSNNSILLDCGEGTMLQLIRYFGSDYQSALQKISCIFVSHLHLDHYMGLFEVVSQRLKAFETSDVPYKPIVLILPFEIDNIFKRFCEVFENLSPAVRIFTCRNVEKRKEKLKQYLENIELSTVPVKHCPDAYGIIIESESKWKVVYSGDTSPCQKLVEAGKDCNLLIHEASIEDDMGNEAQAKKHSTPSQVIAISERMNAEYTIMTHFSKRYLAFPVIPECSTREVGYAFDFMKVQMCDLPLLSLFTPVIKCLFKGQLESREQFSSSISSFENVFLKVLKS